MSRADILVLHGPPGSGKTTVGNAIADILRQARIPHLVLEIDELERIYPEDDPFIKWRILASIWPNYHPRGEIKVILPVLIDTAEDLRQLRAAVPARSMRIGELSAGEAILHDRVTAREPNEFWQSKLRGLVDKYGQRDAGQQFGDFRVRTDERSAESVAREILEHLGWMTTQGRTA
jgi:energy-coupling factor transporter ATP-binding protein EcfA2